jgi:hypothetical protein
MATKRAHDELRAIAAPRELVEWVRKMPPDVAARTAWVDVTRADWIPYLAVVRGVDRETILRATCACALEVAGKIDGPEAERVLALLRAAAETGRAALATAETDLADLRREIIRSSHRTQPRARPAWMPWAELVFELARASSRGNVLVGVALAMRILANTLGEARGRGKLGDRPAHGELVARFRDQLMQVG